MKKLLRSEFVEPYDAICEASLRGEVETMDSKERRNLSVELARLSKQAWRSANMLEKVEIETGASKMIRINFREPQEE